MEQKRQLDTSLHRRMVSTFDAFSQAWLDDNHHEQTDEKTDKNGCDEFSPQGNAIEVQN